MTDDYLATAVHLDDEKDDETANVGLGGDDNFTRAQLIIITSAQRGAAVTGLVASLCLMRLAYKRTRRLACSPRNAASLIFDRIMLAMSVYLTLYAVSNVVASAALPRGTPHSWGAVGTTQTCTAQGLSLQLSLIAPFYYVALSVYSFVAVCHNFDSQRYAWMEPWIHCGAHVVPVCSSVYLLFVRGFNASGNVVACWIDSIPDGCGDDSDVPCTRGPQNIALVSFLCYTLPGLITLTVPPACMIALYCQVRRRQAEIHIPAASVAAQGTLYVAILYLPAGFSLFKNTLRWVLNRDVFGTALVSIVLLNLFSLGVLGMYRYFRRDESDSVGSTINASSLSPGSHLNQKQGGETSSIPEAGHSNHFPPEQSTQQEGKDEEVHRYSFNIFDGTNPTGDFADYIHEGDSEDEAADVSESKRWQTIQDYI